MDTFFHTSLPAHSRIWIYQSDRKLSDTEVAMVQQQGNTFTAGWNAHGQALFSEVFVVHAHFVILAVDEQVAAASGCSIDKSMHFIKSLEQELGISLTNRLNIALKTGETVGLTRLHELEEQIKSGKVSPDQLFFDNTVSSLGLLQNEWIKPLKDSWLSRFLPENAIIS